MYKIFGWWYRWQACKMAAQVMMGCGEDEGLCPRLWSATVFFEMYITSGADGTMEAFGPREPVEIKAVSERIS